MTTELTKNYTRESASKAILAVDQRALDQFKKQKTVMKQIKLLAAAIDRINTLEETVAVLKEQVARLEQAGK